MNNRNPILIALIFLFLMVKSIAAQQTGYACIYSSNLCGHAVATGEKLKCDELTAAHRTIKFGSKVRITNLENDKSVVVVINDRGPYSKKDIVDMTPSSAKKIGLTMNEGRVRVKVEVLDKQAETEKEMAKVKAKKEKAIEKEHLAEAKAKAKKEKETEKKRLAQAKVKTKKEKEEKERLAKAKEKKQKEAEKERLAKAKRSFSSFSFLAFILACAKRFFSDSFSFFAFVFASAKCSFSISFSFLALTFASSFSVSACLSKTSTFTRTRPSCIVKPIFFADEGVISTMSFLE